MLCNIRHGQVGVGQVGFYIFHGSVQDDGGVGLGFLIQMLNTVFKEAAQQSLISGISWLI